MENIPVLRMIARTEEELLTQAEYAEKVHTYDRDQLEEYAATVQEVETLQDTLETEMANLESLEDDYQAQQEELNTTISSKSAEVANLDSMIQEEARKAAEEAAAKADAEELKKKLEEVGAKVTLK